MDSEMVALTSFFYESAGVRVLGTKMEPWFVCRDVFEILEIPINYMARTLKKLDDDEKGAIKLMTPGGVQEVWIISEPGLYKIMLRARTPKAEAFTRFVTHEVLPSIRKRGYYKVPKPVKEKRLTRGRPPLTLSERVSTTAKYKLLNGERCDITQLREICRELGMPLDQISDKRTGRMVEYVNERMQAYGYDSVVDIPKPRYVVEDEPDETYTIVANGVVIELVK